MNDIRTITYETGANGGKIVPFPPEMVFSGYKGDLVNILPSAKGKQALAALASSPRNIYGLSKELATFLSVSEEPHVDIMTITAMVLTEEPGAIRLVYALLMAIPSLERFLEEIVDFHSTGRVMAKIERRIASGAPVDENDDWFHKKVILLSSSLPLPDCRVTDPRSPWLSWSEGVRKAIADPDDRWNEAIIGRAMVELDAKQHRIRDILVSLDPDRRDRLIVSLGSMNEEIKWKKTVLEETAGKRGGSMMILKATLGFQWDRMIASLRETCAGGLVADILENQLQKAHTYPQIRNGAAVLRALMMHPAVNKSGKAPDILSCVHALVESSHGGKLDLLMNAGRKLPGIEENPGFSVDDRMLSIDFSAVDTSHFLEDDLPADVDWMEISNSKKLSYKSLVMSYLDNDSFLTQMLNNPKATNQPGLVALIAQRCRSLRILSMIANRRDLYTGFNNKTVPMNLVMSPAKIPLTTIRKFMHIRYIDKMTLIKLSQKGGSQVREEVRREIDRYLRSGS